MIYSWRRALYSQARYFVETRLLSRDVQIKLEGVDKNGSVLGTVIHPAGNMSVELVKVGLARVVDWSSQFTEHAPALRAAERQAKERRLRMWKDYVPPNHGGGMTEFAGRVVEVVSGDTLIVSDEGNERRVSFSSLRAPRMGREPEPFAAEAKEALRKLVIGKKVRVIPEYKRTFPAPEGGVARENTFVSLFANEKNVPLAMVEQGFASIARHGQADERSTMYAAQFWRNSGAILAQFGAIL